MRRLSNAKFAITNGNECCFARFKNIMHVHCPVVHSEEGKKVIANTQVISNCLRAFYRKSYQRGSLGKIHQNSDYWKPAIRKSCLTTRFELVTFGLPVHCSNLKDAGSNPVQGKLFRNACFKQSPFWRLFTGLSHWCPLG